MTDLPGGVDRCIQTARPVAIALGLPIFIEHGQPHPVCSTPAFAH